MTRARPPAERAAELLRQLAELDDEASRLRAQRRKLEAKLRALYPRDLVAVDRAILFYLSTISGRAVSLREIHDAIASARPTAWKTVQKRLFALRDAGHVRSIETMGRGGTWPCWLLVETCSGPCADVSP